MEIVNVSHLLLETDVIDILFHTCDSTKKGCVHVSAITNYIENMLDMHTQNLEAIKILTECLDPEELDTEVDLQTFREGMLKWIDKIKSADISDKDGCHEKHIEPYKTKVQKAIFSTQNAENVAFQAESTVVENSYRCFESDTVDVACQIEELRQVYQQVLHDNGKLHAQLKFHEDAVVVLMQEKNELLEKIHKLQDIADMQSEILAENEDLKLSEHKLLEQKNEQVSKIHQLERDKTTLLNQLKDSETKLLKLTKEEEASSQLVKELEHTVLTQKLALQTLNESQRILEKNIFEKDQALRETRRSIDQLSDMNKELHENCQVLHCELALLQDQLSKLYSCQQSHSAVLSACSFLCTCSSQSDGEEDSCESEMVMSHLKYFEAVPSDHGSLQPVDSIQKEIKEMVMNSLAFQSPLCAKEQIEMIGANILEEEIYTAQEIDMKLLQIHLQSFSLALSDSINVSLFHKERQGIITDTELGIKEQQNIFSPFDNLHLLESNDGNECFFQKKNIQRAVLIERLNLQIVTEFHKAEHKDLSLCSVRIRDLQETVQAALNLEKQVHRCSKLEESSSAFALARQLDMHDIWRLVQKDIEAEYLDSEDDCEILPPAEIHKEKVLQDIKVLHGTFLQSTDLAESLKGEPPSSLPLQRTPDYHRSRNGCCGYRVMSPSSPLVDALTIDFIPLFKNPRTNMNSESYFNYLHWSCEDVDCLSCRAVRLGLDFHEVASCPSLEILNHNHSVPGLAEKQHDFASLNYNINSNSNHQFVSSVSSVTSFDGVDLSSHNNKSSSNHPLGKISTADSTSAQHRRIDFCKGLNPSVSATVDSFTSNSLDSVYNSEASLYQTRLPSYNTMMSHYTGHKENAFHQSDSSHLCGPYSPAGFRRMSFVSAVDKSSDHEFDKNRRASYKAAIDRQVLGSGTWFQDSHSHDYMNYKDDCEYENHQSSQTTGSGENKSVTFQLMTNDGKDHQTFSLNSLSSVAESDSGSKWGSVPNRGASGQIRKLSILLEEGDLEDALRSPDIYNLSSPRIRSSSEGDIDDANWNYQTYQPEVLDNEDQTSSLAKSYNHAIVTMTPASFMSSAVRELKNGAEIPSNMCGTDKMPAHFKYNSAAVSSSPYGAGAPVKASGILLVSDEVTSDSVVLVPESPRTARETHVSPESTSPSRLDKLRQSNLAKKREQMKSMKLPELSEQGERAQEVHQHPEADVEKHRLHNYEPAPETSDLSDEEMGTSQLANIETVKQFSDTVESITPSIPDSFLKSLDMLFTDETKIDKDGIDELPEKELESRFTSLALAFKTDRLTLEKRLGIQERSRDIAEQNIEKELLGLRDAVETLNRLCTDENMKDVIMKIQHHLDILEHSVARVSSRAEVFGAVQQEKRMSLAMEVMITHTENIRRLREKELAEVEEARKILSEKTHSSSNLALEFGNIGDRRSASVCAGLNNHKSTRRRSEVALPRIFGGMGIPSFSTSSNLDSSLFTDFSQPSSHSGSRQNLLEGAEEPRQKFQSATANITVRNLVTSTLQRATLERQRKTLSQSSSSTGQNMSRSSSNEQPSDKEQMSKQHSQEEEAYRQGYEEGLKANLSRELTELRDQQTAISGGLEKVMDHIETFQHENEQDGDIEETISMLRKSIAQARLWMSYPTWQSASQTLRLVLAGFIFFIAIVVVVFTFAPLVPSNVTVRSQGTPTQ